MTHPTPRPGQRAATVAITPSAQTRTGSRPAWRRIAIGALVAAGADAAFAFVGYVLIDGRYNFESLLQYIASGLVGQRAFAGGGAGIGYAALGFAIHAVLALAFTVLYAAVLAPRVRHTRAVVAGGLAYGAAIWVFMNAVVLPLGRSTQEDFGNGWWFAFLIDHALLVGLPIAVALAPGAGPVQIGRGVR
jgi:hypothetical protein